MTFSLCPLCFVFCHSSYYSLHSFINVFVFASLYLENRGPVYPFLSLQSLEKCLSLVNRWSWYISWIEKERERGGGRGRRREWGEEGGRRGGREEWTRIPPNPSLSGFTDTALLDPYCTHWEFPLEISQKHHVSLKYMRIQELWNNLKVKTLEN